MSTGPLDRIDYFAEWGGRSWKRLLEFALRDFLGADLAGQAVLDIGFQSGKMSTLFALMGGNVTGVDIDPSCLPKGAAEARRFGVEDRTVFRHYQGDLDVLPDASFDVVFTKSVLVMVPDLGGFLAKIERKLRPHGRVVFLENARGNLLIHAIRRLKNRRRDKGPVPLNYFSNTQVTMVKSQFELRHFRQTGIPPVCLICGYKRSPSSVP